jgi:ABC-type branched-subunit amino acid transport system substrate-binding protein
MIYRLLPDFRDNKGESFVLSSYRPRRGIGSTAAAFMVVVSALLLLSACVGSRIGLPNAAPRQPIVGNAPVTGEVLGTGPVKVALLLPLSATGNAGQIALNLKNAADLALREFQTPAIQLLVKDDRGTPSGARAATSEAIQQGAELIIGPLFAQSVSAAAAIAKPANVPIIAFSTDTSSAASGVYLLSFLPQTDVDRIVRYAASQGKRSYAALLPANAYGTVVEASLQKSVANVGGRVMALERYQLDRTSMQERASVVANLVKSGTVDAILLPDAGDAAPFLGQILAASGVSPSLIQYLGSGQWADTRIAQESNLNGGWYPAPENGGFEAFSRRYQAAFGATPFRAATLAYDATSLASGLAARFGDRRFSADVLTSSSGFIGLDGAFRLLSNGLNERGLAIYRIDRGQVTIIDPAPRTFTRPAI